MQSSMSTQEKGILMPGVDSCIVKDQKCPIIAKFSKKNPVQTADGGLLVRACHVFEHYLLITYDYCKQFTIMIAIPSHFG